MAGDVRPSAAAGSDPADGLRWWSCWPFLVSIPTSLIALSVWNELERPLFVESFAGAFDDLLALELGDGGEHGEDQFAEHVVAGVQHDAVESAEVPAVGV